MAATLTMDELKNMNLADLKREIREQSAMVAKLRLGISMKKEKDTAKFKREKKQLARMLTVLTQKTVDAAAPAAGAKDTAQPSPQKS